MAHPDLESARVKLNRAREHVIAQQTQTRSALKAEAHPFDFRLEEEAQNNRIVVVVDHVAAYSPLLGAIIGDALYNFRCVLDHIAWALVQHGTTPNLKPRDTTQVQFPIYLTLKKFDDNLARRLPGIRDVHEAIVRQHQPYKRGNLANDHPLVVLSRLNNRDKHRDLQPVLLGNAEFKLTVPVIGPGCEVVRLVQGPDIHKPLQVNAILAYIYVRGVPSCRDAGMEVQADGTVLPSLGEGLWLDDTIRHIDRTVERILTDFDRVL